MSQDDPQYVMPPKEAARQLGVAASTLRRLAPTYEAVHGPLPWEGDEAGGGRLWPAEAVERVQDARALVAEGRAKSLESALRALAGGAPPPSGVLSRPDEATALIEALREELRADREDRQALREEVAALRSELAESRALPPAANAERINRALEVELLESQEAPARPDPGTGSGTVADDPGSADGPMVRVARWVERRLRGGRSS